MNGYIAFVKKEFMENIKNYRFFILFAVFLTFGIASAFLAKFFLTGVRVIFQGKPPYEVFPTAVYRIRKTPKRFRKKEPTKGKISINNFKKLRLCLIM